MVHLVQVINIAVLFLGLETSTQLHAKTPRSVLNPRLIVYVHLPHEQLLSAPKALFPKRLPGTCYSGQGPTSFAVRCKPCRQ